MIRGFVFGDFDSEPYAHVTAVSRTVAPERRIERTSVPGRDGDYAYLGGFEAVEITVTAYLTARTVDGVSDQRRAMAEALCRGPEQRLVLPDEPTRYYMAIYEGGAELSRNAGRPMVELKFLCADPIAYGAHRSAKVSGTRTVKPGGTYRTHPIISVTPPAGSSWQITDVGSGRFVRVVAQFTGKQSLVIDTCMSRCTVNGSDYPMDAASDPELFYLDGTTQLKVSGGEALIEWEERWL